jgi:hypothetical protein
LKSQDEKLQDLNKKVEIYKTIERKWIEALFIHKQQKNVLSSQVKALTKEKKEKENVLIDLELMNMKNACLLQSEELKRKKTKVKIEKLMEEKEY